MSLTLSTVGDGRLGFPDGAPYDAIHVGAAAATIPKAVREFTDSSPLFRRCKRRTSMTKHIQF